MSTVEIDQLYREGVAAIKRGQKAEGRRLLEQVIAADQMHEQAWLWLSSVVDDREEQIICLENVLTINPENEAARRGLLKLGAPLPQPPEPLEEEQEEEAEEEAAPGWRVQPRAADDADDLPFMQVEAEAPRPLLMHGSAPIMESTEEREARRRRESRSGADGRSNAIYIRDEEESSTTLLDLFEAWLGAIIFKVRGPFGREVMAGNFAHAFFNIGFMSFIQVTLLAMAAGYFLLLAGGDFASILDQAAAQDPDVAELQQLIESGAFDLPSNPLTIGLYAVGYVFGSLVLFFLGIMIRSMVIDRAAHWLFGARGDVIQLVRAMTIALVAGQITFVPVFILTLILPPLGLLLMVPWGLHQYAMNVAAVGVAEEIGFIPAAVVLAVINPGTFLGLCVGATVLLPLIAGAA